MENEANIIFSDWLKPAAQKLSNALNISIEDAFAEANYLARRVTDIQLLSTSPLSSIAIFCLNKALEKRCDHMPLAKIIQLKDFYKYTFVTTKDTLDPRPETEKILELIAIKARSILDLGTGTGCLIISALKILHKSTGTAVDISQSALNIAQENAAILQCNKKITFKHNNWANDIKGHFDLILANPPYVVESNQLGPELKHDPSLALFGDSQTYNQMFASLANITFLQMLVEIPFNFIEKLNMPFSNQIDMNIHKIENTEIAVLDIRNKNIDEKILLTKSMI